MQAGLPSLGVSGKVSLSSYYMHEDVDIDAVAGALQVSIGLLRRRLHQTQAKGELTLPETSALARLDRSGPTTVTALAKLEQISPQSMGATIGALEARGLIERRPDPNDGRRAVISATESGLQVIRNLRNLSLIHISEPTRRTP